MAPRHGPKQGRCPRLNKVWDQGRPGAALYPPGAIPDNTRPFVNDPARPESMTDLLIALLGAALVNNLLLAQAAGGDAQPRLQALARAGGLMLALGLPLAWLLDRLLLAPLALDHLRPLVLLPLLAPLAWAALALLKHLPGTADVPNGLFPLLLGNGAVLGGLYLAASSGFVHALGLALAGGIGFWLALGLFADLMQRVDAADVPAPLRGTPITLLCAGLMGVALMGFNGLVAP